MRLNRIEAKNLVNKFMNKKSKKCKWIKMDPPFWKKRKYFYCSVF